MKEIKKYLEGSAELPLWAYESCTDTWRQFVKDGRRVRVELPKTLTTIETMRLYKAAGFNQVLIGYMFQENVESPEYDFQKSRVKYAMDLAHEVGLKCVVFVENVHRLSRAPWGDYETHDPSVIGEDKQFKSMDDLVEYIKYCYRGIIDHPAYYGTFLRDEPQCHQIERVGQIYKAMRLAFGEKHYILFNLLPYYYCSPKWRRQLSTYEYEKKDSIECYKEYMRTYYEHIGKYSGYIRYDAYPLLDERYDGEGKLLHGQLELDTFLFGKQMIEEYAQELGMSVAHVVQTCKYADRRAPSNDDIRWMALMGIGMGERDMAYYTYYPPINSGEMPWDDSASIVNVDGKPNPKYYEIKELNERLKNFFKVTSFFRYKSLNTYTFGATATVVDPIEEGRLKRTLPTEIERVEAEFERGGVVLVVEHEDREDGKLGYFIMNITTPREKQTARAKVFFKGYKKAQVWDGRETKAVALENGVLPLTLGVGEGVFVIPFEKA